MYLYKMVTGVQLEEVEGKLEGLDPGDALAGTATVMST